MQHAITIGDLVWWGVGVGGVVAVLAVVFYFVAAFGRGMSR
jgi:hypothetical protein